MGLKHQINFSFLLLSHFSSSNHTGSSPPPIEQNPQKHPPQDSPFPPLPCEQTQRKPTPSPSGIQWLEDLFHSEQKGIPFLILAFKVSELTLPSFLAPFQHDELPICTLTTPILGPSEVPPTDNDSTCEPWHEVALMHSTEVPFDNYEISLLFMLPAFPHPSFDHLQLIQPLPTLS
ncbi:hypothetical protein O181_016068 [Austropuccinia psidii MF-1]|uniref:Uncharacterized protein n=1 Tax=Austropuccinia psidii MF-1 TaxID=1389203 RepID=A0A9Q3C4F2_9BASI|nr:hypothetical protein [Austropuccinia psidii MF-1]